MLTKFLVLNALLVLVIHSHAKEIYHYQDSSTGNIIISDKYYSDNKSLHLKRVMNYPDSKVKVRTSAQIQNEIKKFPKVITSDGTQSIIISDDKDTPTQLDLKILEKTLKEGS
jgi:hypothetical protein